jgi:hypothetical protein
MKHLFNIGELGMIFKKEPKESMSFGGTAERTNLVFSSRGIELRGLTADWTTVQDFNLYTS